MITVSRTYLWLVCDKVKQKLLDMQSLKANTFLDFINRTQSDYAKEHELPYFELIPKFTLHKKLNGVMIPESVIDLHERMTIFDFGGIVYELKWRIDAQDLNFETMNETFKIDGYKPFGMAISRKKTLHEVTEIENNACICNTLRVVSGPSFIRSYGKQTTKKMLKYFTGSKTIQFRDIDLYYQKDAFLIPVNFKKNVTNHLITSLTTISLIFYFDLLFVGRLYNRIKLELLPIRDRNNWRDFDKIEENFLRIFLYRFYWSNSNFIGRIDGPLYIRSMERVLINEVSKLKIRDNQMDIEEFKSLTSTIPIPTILKLYNIIGRIPGNLFSKYYKYISPFSITPVKSVIREHKLSKLEIDISYRIAEQTGRDLEDYPIPSSFDNDINIGLYTTSQVVKMLNRTAGEGNKRVIDALTSLVGKKILTKVDPSKVKRRGTAKEYYRLNPTNPFTQLLLSHYYG